MMLFLGVMAPIGGFLSSARVLPSARLGDDMGSIAIRLSRSPVDVLFRSGSELGLLDRILAGPVRVVGTEI
jgi:hypothetical protein